MKVVLIASFLLSLLSKSTAQVKGGFVSLTGEIFANENLNRFGLNATGGVKTSNRSTLGASFDFYIFKKDESYLVPHIDARIFFQDFDKSNGLFVSIQPGWVFYNKSTRVGGQTISTRGNLAFDLLGGTYLKPADKFPGLVFSAGFL